MLFADEPTGTLDPETATLVHKMLTECTYKRHGDGSHVHFSNVVEDVADRAILLEDGEILAIGEPDEVISRFMQDYSDAGQYPDSGGRR